MVEESAEVYCAKCSLQLPLILNDESDEAVEWSCSRCGEVCVGVFDTTAPEELWGNVRHPDFPQIV